MNNNFDKIVLDAVYGSKITKYYISFEGYTKEKQAEETRYWRIVETNLDLDTSEGLVKYIEYMKENLDKFIHIRYIRELKS